MKPIGGFFELELEKLSATSYHPQATALAYGRVCLKAILLQIKPAKVFVPFYCCNSLLVPIQELKIPYVFYNINTKLELTIDLQLQPQEFVLYINYFGLKSSYVSLLKKKFGAQLIIDNTQAFFEKSDMNSWAFNSARKFFGVPDGGYLYSLSKYEFNFAPNENYEYRHLIQRWNGEQEQAYQNFCTYESAITTELKTISNISAALLSSINYDDIKQKRVNNFKIYHDYFSSINLFGVVSLEDCVPFCYPLLLSKKIDKEFLYTNNIFVPILWNDVIDRKETEFEFEKTFSKNLLPLPCDHRYDENDIKQVIEKLKIVI